MVCDHTARKKRREEVDSRGRKAGTEAFRRSRQARAEGGDGSLLKATGVGGSHDGRLRKPAPIQPTARPAGARGAGECSRLYQRKKMAVMTDQWTTIPPTFITTPAV